MPPATRVYRGQEGDARAEQAGQQSDHDALDGGQADEVAPARAPGAEQSQVAAIALDGPQRGEVGQAERDQGAGHREHDVQRLGIERVAGCRGELVGQVVDELDLTGEGTLGAAPELLGPR